SRSRPVSDAGAGTGGGRATRLRGYGATRTARCRRRHWVSRGRQRRARARTGVDGQLLLVVAPGPAVPAVAGDRRDRAPARDASSARTALPTGLPAARLATAVDGAARGHTGRP